MSKIDGFGQKSPQVNGGNRGNAVDRSGGEPAAAGKAGQARGDTVTLTDGARRLQRLAEAVAAAPAADAGRAEAVKQSIARGEYQVDAERVAARIIQSERDLAGR